MTSLPTPCTRDAAARRRAAAIREQATRAATRIEAGLRASLRDDRGQDLIEYALLASFVALVAIAGATLLGTTLNNWFSAVAGNANAAAGTAS